jgi:hypothetical protein
MFVHVGLGAQAEMLSLTFLGDLFVKNLKVLKISVPILFFNWQRETCEFEI